VSCPLEVTTVNLVAEASIQFFRPAVLMSNLQEPLGACFGANLIHAAFKQIRESGSSRLKEVFQKSRDAHRNYIADCEGLEEVNSEAAIATIIEMLNKDQAAAEEGLAKVGKFWKVWTLLASGLNGFILIMGLD